VVVGIGVNLNFPRELMPKAIQNQATSFLILTQKTVDRGTFTSRLIQDLDQCYGVLEGKGFPFIAKRWGYAGWFRPGQGDGNRYGWGIDPGGGGGSSREDRCRGRHPHPFIGPCC
jgi:hypothetical protein